MKRPIAEFLTMTLREGAGAERAQCEQEAWQILRRKQGYVTHRIYQQCSDPLQRLVYSEWETKKAADGARQHLQGTPLERRARACLVTAPQRLVVEMVGPLTSTKGLELPEGAVAAPGMARSIGADRWQAQEEALVRLHTGLAGHITSVLFRGFNDPGLVGSLSHWVDARAFADALEHARSREAGEAGALMLTLEYVQYSVAQD